MNECHPQVNAFLAAMVKHEASDLYLTTGAKASIKVMGGFKHLTKESLKPGMVATLTKSMLTRLSHKNFT